MLEKLRLVEERYLEMAERAGQPDFYADPKAASKLLREQKRLEPIVTAYRSYRKTEQEAQDLRGMLDAGGLDAELKELCQEEYTACKKKLETLEQELKILLLPRDPNDDKSVIVEIRGGVGGEESALFAHSLYRMYTMYAQSKGWKVTLLNYNETELGGVKEAVATVEGAGVNFKLGVVYSPVPNLRLGMAFHTPTFYSLDRRYGMSMSTASIGATSETDPRPHDYTSDTASDILEDSGDSGWEFVSPSRLMFGASYTFGDVAIVSVDYERDWYNGIRVKNMPYLAYGPAASDFKQDMKYYFKGSNTVRAGVEVRPLPMLSVRAGFGYNGSMLRDERTILSSPAVAETTYYTAGLGFSLSRSVYLDVAYCYVKDTTTPYMLFYGNRYADDEAKTEIYQSEVYTTDFTRHNVALTLGFRF